jgi:hypothetical protein
MSEDIEINKELFIREAENAKREAEAMVDMLSTFGIPFEIEGQ